MAFVTVIANRNLIGPKSSNSGCLPLLLLAFLAPLSLVAQNRVERAQRATAKPEATQTIPAPERPLTQLSSQGQNAVRAFLGRPQFDHFTAIRGKFGDGFAEVCGKVFWSRKQDGRRRASWWFVEFRADDQVIEPGSGRVALHEGGEAACTNAKNGLVALGGDAA